MTSINHQLSTMYTPGEHLAKDWSKVDWSLSSREIGELMHCSGNTVDRLRKIYGRPSRYTESLKGPPVDWLTVDWSLSNNKLSRHYGCAESFIAAKRKEIGAPLSRREQVRRERAANGTTKHCASKVVKLPKEMKEALKSLICGRYRREAA